MARCNPSHFFLWLSLSEGKIEKGQHLYPFPKYYLKNGARWRANPTPSHLLSTNQKQERCCTRHAMTRLSFKIKLSRIDGQQRQNIPCFSACTQANSRVRSTSRDDEISVRASTSHHIRGQDAVFTLSSLDVPIPTKLPPHHRFELSEPFSCVERGSCCESRGQPQACKAGFSESGCGGGKVNVVHELIMEKNWVPQDWLAKWNNWFKTRTVTKQRADPSFIHDISEAAGEIEINAYLGTKAADIVFMRPNNISQAVQQLDLSTTSSN
ncbi:hypothetical protein EDB19DRAFT_1822201 [Suillus lakei]|nr:hypothetical protein EDB19DRAFT_1822201 [Suillus lakei]